MEIQKEGEVMAQSDSFERLPFEYDYEWFKKDFNRIANMVMETGSYDAINSANGALANWYEGIIEENGMERVAVIVVASLYELEHGDIESDMKKKR